MHENKLGDVLGDVDVYLGDKVVGPDVLFVSKNRLDIITEFNVQGAPDLVIEVLSPSTAVHDKKTKSQLFCENGVKEYWTIDPDQKLVEVLIAGEKEWRWSGVYDIEDVLTTMLLPGLEIKLQDVFV